eukprot:TRINITY_DN3058_c0_g1_i1.p1 TRINITY_DN3058_c0_g1~~TRINITY_DN3058_c0_g1_i1.p1  ORF type:complete len:108 (-),score=37.35 TRINITY_DN3058_c0_g1_i1:47-370(-)
MKVGGCKVPANQIYDLDTKVQFPLFTIKAFPVINVYRALNLIWKQSKQMATSDFYIPLGDSFEQLEEMLAAVPESLQIDFPRQWEEIWEPPAPEIWDDEDLDESNFE